MNQRHPLLTLSLISSFSVFFLLSNIEFAETRLVWIPHGGSIHNVASGNILNNISESYKRVSDAEFTISIQSMKHVCTS